MARSNRNANNSDPKAGEAQEGAKPDGSTDQAGAQGDATTAVSSTEEDAAAAATGDTSDTNTTAATDSPAGGEPPAGDTEIPPGANPNDAAPVGGWCYELLEPIKLGESIVKPARKGEAPVFVQLDDDLAGELIDAKVVGAEQTWPPQQDL